MIQAAAALVLPDDQPALQRIDPFFELRIADDWASAERAEKEAGRVPAFRWLALSAGLLGALLGPASWFLRNRASDESMFSQVREAAERGTDNEFAKRRMEYTDKGKRPPDALDDIAFERAKRRRDSLAAYLSMDPEGRHAIEADDLLFDMVMKADDLSTYAIYLVDVRGRRHLEEVDDAMLAAATREGTRSAYQQYFNACVKQDKGIPADRLHKAEIAEAKEKHDVTELLAIGRRSGDKWTKAVSEAIHEVYADRLGALRQKKGPGAEEALALWSPVLARLDTREDPRVTLDVDFVQPNAFQEADRGLEQEYKDRYQPVGPAFSRLSGDVEERVSRAILTQARTTFGGAIQFLTSVEKGGPEFPRLVVAMTLVAGDELFVSRYDNLVFCDVRIRLEMHAEILGAVAPTSPVVRTTSHLAKFRPNDYDRLAKAAREALGNVTDPKPLSEAYVLLIRGASEESIKLLGEAF
jgi:hypothetical protein